MIVQEDSHLYCDSGDCAEVLSNLNLVTLARGAGTFTLEDVQSEIERTSGGRVRTSTGTSGTIRSNSRSSTLSPSKTVASTFPATHSPTEGPS